jgi:periplasmic glucans biosynthesis protein
MWMWGDGSTARPAKDPRPKVHDCDGLLVRTSCEEWIWRAITRPNYPSLSHFEFAGIRGFGLMQRDRRRESYRDDEAKYHLRPSVWIEPKQGWSDGAIELIELPAEHEGVDNVAAWWKPNRPVQVGAPMDFEYRVTFMASEPKHGLARAIATRVVRREGERTRIEIDFAGGRLADFAADTVLACHVKALQGDVGNLECAKQADGRWQVKFDVRPAGARSVELSASLGRNGESLTEVWRYLCSS